MDDFESELKASFLQEAEQAVSDVEQAFIELEADPSNRQVLDRILRLAHNLKGSSKAVGFDQMGDFTHCLETFLLRLKEESQVLTNDAVSLLLKCSDHISTMIKALGKDFRASFDDAELIQALETYSFKGAPEQAKIEPNMDLLRELGAYDEIEKIKKNRGEEADELIHPPANEPVATDTGQEELLAEETVNKEQVDNGQSVAEEAAPAESVMDSPSEVVAEPTQLKVVNEPLFAKAGETESVEIKQTVDESIRISLSRLETLVNYVGEMSILQSVMQAQDSGENPVLSRTVHQMGKVMKEVQDLSMSLRMVPIKPLFLKMKRIVRDISTELDKKVSIFVHGEETEVDKTVLEKINDPMVHLIRNSVDHGIEFPGDRLQNSKSEEGNVIISALHQGGRLVIEVSDDGRGIDPEKIRKKAIEKGLIGRDQVVTPQTLQNLIFSPGFSTKDSVTDISGRGVGMDVVKTNIESMNGEISVVSEPLKGTTFRISLPLTLAIIDAMVVQIGDSRFVVPLSHVMESLCPDQDHIKRTTCAGDVLLLRGDNIPIFWLSQLLGMPTDKSNESNQSVMVVKVGDGSVAIVVDEIVGQFQVVIKQLGLEAQNFRGISATTILGDGKPALILEIPELVGETAVINNHRSIAV